MSTHSRPQRVAQEIQEEIAQILSRGLKDPRIGFVTVTGVKIGPDLKQATIYYSVLDETTSLADTQKGLESAAGYLRRELGANLKLKYAPLLVFKYDPSVAQGDRIDRLLREAREAGKDQAAAKASDEEKS